MSEHVRFPIDGMTCTSCVARITKAVRNVPGVESVKVDLGTDSATVGFDPGRTTLVSIGEAVERSGYEARLSDAEPWAPRARGGWLARLGR